jgi:hypothetical protein
MRCRRWAEPIQFAQGRAPGRLDTRKRAAAACVEYVRPISEAMSPEQGLVVAQCAFQAEPGGRGAPWNLSADLA